MSYFVPSSWEKARSMPERTFLIMTALFSALSGGAPGPFESLPWIASRCPTDT